VEVEQFDEMISESESTTRNPPGCERRLAALEGEGTFVFYGVPRRAGDRGRTGDVQLGKLAFYH
jgi:hypothetical protein